jgi:hypothetical protein
LTCKSRGAVLAVLVALIALCVEAGRAEEDSAPRVPLAVRARLCTADGRPTGGAVVLYGENARTILGAFRVDASGRMDGRVDVPPTEQGVRVVLCSAGWLRHCADERNERLVTTHVKEDSLVEQYSQWPMGSAAALVEFASSRSAVEFAEIVPVMGGRSTIEVVGRAVPPEAVGAGRVDLGAVSFRVRRDFVQVEIALEQDDGRPYEDAVVIVGMPLNRRTMYGNRFYPHMALTQEGARARLLLTRAGTRLLRFNAASMVTLAGRYDRQWAGKLELPEDEWRKLGMGQSVVKGRCVIAKRPVSQQAPSEPFEWDYGEPSFVR